MHNTQRQTMVSVFLLSILNLLIGTSSSFQIINRHHAIIAKNGRQSSPFVMQANMYDEWSADIPVDTMPLEEELVHMCLDELIYSDFGGQMFGVHDRPASLGITGVIELAEIEGPEVFLTLSGKFWHTRSHVLGRAAMYLNARIPEIIRVSVLDRDELNDFQEIIDEDTGDVIEVIDRRAPDFNGDRETMIYQGIDPDMRGPFPISGSSGGDFKIIPA